VSGLRVLVFCGSSESADPGYAAAAAELGTSLARARHEVVYGGGTRGSMGALADAALAAGGRVVGVLPGFMRELEWHHDGLHDLLLVGSMQERKFEMLERADAVVALPGGSGTIEELFDTITAKRLGRFTGPIVVVDQDGFFQPLLAQLQRCIDERFLHPRHARMWQAVSSAADVVPALAAAPPWEPDAIRFAAL